MLNNNRQKISDDENYYLSYFHIDQQECYEHCSKITGCHPAAYYCNKKRKANQSSEIKERRDR